MKQTEAEDIASDIYAMWSDLQGDNFPDIYEMIEFIRKLSRRPPIRDELLMYPGGERIVDRLENA